MFAGRFASRAASAVKQGAKRFHAAARQQKTGSIRAVALGAAAAASVAAFAVSRSGAVCSPDSIASPSPAVLNHSSADPINYYQQTESLLNKLPKTASEIASTPYDTLADIYDPDYLANKLSPLPNIELMFSKDDADPFHRHAELLVRSFQNRICNSLLDIEKMSGATLTDIDGQPVNDETRRLLLNQLTVPGQFRETIVTRPNGTGGGIERVLNGGRVFSKAGVNVSVSHLSPPPAVFHRLLADHPSLKDVTPPTTNFKLWTASISLVLHPVSPNVPTSHANYRYFEMTLPDGKQVWWFGGGADLTPTWVVDEDARFFHRTIKRTLDRLDTAFYPKMKKWCDEYFFIRHRGETRGVGGVIYDDLQGGGKTKDQYEQVMRRLGDTFSSQYFPVVLKTKDIPFNAQELEFQQLRRGRYVEFNLVYDKGTSYGLMHPTARPDAILMSLPAVARFTYKQPFDKEPREAYTKHVLSNPQQWA